MAQLPLGLFHGLLEEVLGFAFSVGGKDKAHPAAGHAAEHPETPEIIGKTGFDALDESFSVKIARPGDDRLERLEEIAGGGGANGADILVFQSAQHFIEHADGLFAGGPLGLAAQEVFFGDHLKNRPDILRHAAMDKHPGCPADHCGLWRGLRIRRGCGERASAGHG